MRKSTWNTYATYAYIHDMTNDQRSAGGVHCHQVRKIGKQWQKRVNQSNGVYDSYTEPADLTEAEGLDAFARAVKF